MVLGVTPSNGTIVVRHAAFGGMPAMTMTFAVRPKSRVRELQPGAIIDAAVDVRTEPWTLRDVTSDTAQAVTAAPAVRHVAALLVGDSVPGTAFVDQDGKPFDFAQLRGSDVVLAFIYTRCQDARMCPLISAKFHALQSMLAKRPVRLVEVTLDPTYDRPPVLARYAKTFGADARRWTLAVGGAAETLDFAARFGIASFPDPDVGIVHSENTVLIGPAGKIAEMIADPSWTPEEIVGQIDAIDGRGTNVAARFALWMQRTAAGVLGIEPGRWDGLRDIAIGALVVAAMAYLVRRLYRAIFAEHA